jgi:predicted alpha/beta-hydrolase family hydrolase
MLFLQGTRDALADYELVELVAVRLGERATLATFEGADHSFHVRGGRGTKSDLIPALAETMSAWMRDRR